MTDSDDGIRCAVARLLAGELVAFPTETVYGLGADARNAEAMARLFARKGRPADHPIIVHIAAADALARWSATVPPAAMALATAFWPGPLTMILQRRPDVLDAVTGGQSTVGLRCPAHPVALQLLAACAAVGIDGLAAPSANRFGQVSPTTAAHVRAEFGADLLVLDGGPAHVGIESTIVDLSGDAPRILRPGMLGAAQIAAVLAAPLATDHRDVPRVSGSLAAHYAPSKPLELMSGPALVACLAARGDNAAPVAVLAPALTGPLPDGVQWLPMSADAPTYARALYARLREADALAVARILVEMPPADAAWVAIHDRLRRAAQGADKPRTAPVNGCRGH